VVRCLTTITKTEKLFQNRKARYHQRYLYKTILVEAMTRQHLNDQNKNIPTWWLVGFSDVVKFFEAIPERVMNGLD